jgi:uncharacterized protein (UPF0332 family)
MQALEFLDFAQTIAGHGVAGARSAVSRAYYGTFHFAIEILAELECNLESRNSHGLVLRVLASIEHEEAKGASALLSDLQSNRVKSDYKLMNTAAESRAFADICVELAHEIKRSLLAIREACTDPTTRSKFVSGIQEYRRKTNQ